MMTTVDVIDEQTCLSRALTGGKPTANTSRRSTAPRSVAGRRSAGTPPLRGTRSRSAGSAARCLTVGRRGQRCHCRLDVLSSPRCDVAGRWLHGGIVIGDRLLLDGVLTGDLASRAQAVTLFAFANAHGLAGALATRDRAVDRYAYLVKPLEAQSPCASNGPRGWRSTDAEATATLLARVLRALMPRAVRAAWRDGGGREHVGQLIGAAGCGTIMVDSCVAPAGRSRRLAGVVLVTRLSATTAHIAQIAVDPLAQRRGVGRLLVDEACDRARRAG